MILKFIKLKMFSDSIEFTFRTFDIGNNFGASVRPVCLGVQELVLRTLQTRAPTMFREVECGIYRVSHPIMQRGFSEKF